MIECMRNAARKPQTNADRIRNMSDEELAEFMAYNAYCEECYVKKDDSFLLLSRWNLQTKTS